MNVMAVLEKIVNLLFCFVSFNLGKGLCWHNEKRGSLFQCQGKMDLITFRKKRLIIPVSVEMGLHCIRGKYTHCISVREEGLLVSVEKRLI